MSSSSFFSAAHCSALAGLSSATRLYTLDIEGLSGADALQFEAFWGQETLSAPYRFELLCLSASSQLSLASLLGRQLRFDLRLADGSSHARSGYIVEARRLGADGALTRYQLSIAPWLWQLSQRSDCRVFQDKTVLEIVERVFAPYAPRAAWQLADGVESFMADAPVRSDCVQYRETDLAFVSRLLAEEGLGYCFVPATAETTLGQAPLHQLLIFSSNDALPEDKVSSSTLGGQGIRFHRADALEAQDAITALGATRVLQAAVSSTLSWDYTTRRAVAASLPTDQAFGGPNAPLLEDYDLPGAHAYASEASALRYLRLAREAIEARNKVFTGTGSVRSFAAGHRFVLIDSPLDREADLRGESRSADTTAASRHFLLTGLSHVGINNLPREPDETVRVLREAMCEGMSRAATDSELALLAQARRRGYANAFSAQRGHLPWRPILHDDTGRRLNPRPLALGPQTATVVGANGETTPGEAGEIHTDALHRVRVQFHWQGAHPEGGTANASAWLSVASRYAGRDLGAQFVPRIGQRVLVGFLENDIDRPIVLGSLHDGSGEGAAAATPGGATPPLMASDFSGAKDHRPSHQGNRQAAGHSPAWHGEAAAFGPMRNAAALSGFKSAEHNRPHAGYSQLVFDDSDGQQGIRLATTQAATQLNLGHLIHQADNYRGSHRGDGFELRSDAYGALRGGRGLMLSTWPVQGAIDRPGAEPIGDATAATALLKQADQLARALSDVAATHQTVKLASAEGSNAAGKSTLKSDLAPQPAMLKSARGMVSADAASSPQSTAQGSVPHSEDPLLTLAARGGLGMVAGQSLQWASAETLNWVSGQDSNFALASCLRLHTGQALGLLAGAQGKGHLKLIAASGALLAQAQADQMRVAAKQQLKLISVTGKLQAAAAKKIHLAVTGGAAITIEGGNITVQCPGTITVHASQRSLAGPAQADSPLPQMPQSVCKACLLAALRSGSPFVAPAAS